MKAATPLEAAIQARVVKLLEAQGWTVIRLMMSSRRGWPDLLAVRAGNVIFLEVKRPGEKPTALQAHRHAELARQRVPVLVVDSVEATQEALARLAAPGVVKSS